MKKPNFKKTFALSGALLTGGMTIGFVGLAPHIAEARMLMN
jgi:hypothetical protein